MSVVFGGTLWSVFATGGILAALGLSFLILFFLPAVRLQSHLRRLLTTLQSQASWNLPALENLFEDDRHLAHVWREFCDTLHQQKEHRDGQEVVVAWRATMPAEAFFNSQTLLDTRLRTEFFKHLPGIFTGIGIIGTFLGLIQGLRAFDVSENPAVVRQSLDALLKGVTHAFYVSAAAICLAMVVTFVEKLLLSSLYGCVQGIAERLDGLFSAGAGEDYLSRLVVASEDSASQSKILKDSLVGDLKGILQDIADRQILASEQSTRALGQQIQEGLKEPIERIGGLVQAASGDQSEAATRMLKDVMASFSQRLNDLFGGQIGGINQLNQQTAQSMEIAVAALRQLTMDLQTANQRSSEAIAQRTANTLDEMSRRQSELNDQTRIVVEQVRQQMAVSHADTNAGLQTAVESMGAQVAAIVRRIEDQARTALVDQRSREDATTARTGEMVAAMGDHVADVIRQLADSTRLMQQSVASLDRAGTNMVSQMAAGAGMLEKGAVAFGSAAERGAAGMDRAATMSTKMAELTGALTSASTTLQGVLSDHRATREQTSAVVTEARAIVEMAKREASITEDVLARLQSAAERLTTAQGAADQYLARVSEVIEEAHAAFAKGISLTLERATGDFHTKLSSSVGLLKSAIDELEVTVSSAADRR